MRRYMEVKASIKKADEAKKQAARPMAIVTTTAFAAMQNARQDPRTWPKGPDTRFLLWT